MLDGAHMSSLHPLGGGASAGHWLDFPLPESSDPCLEIRVWVSSVFHWEVAGQSGWCGARGAAEKPSRC